MCGDVYMHVEDRYQCWVSVSIASHTIVFLAGSFTYCPANGDLTRLPAYPALGLQADTATPDFPCWCSVFNLGLQACVGSTLPTDISQPMTVLFYDSHLFFYLREIEYLGDGEMAQSNCWPFREFNSQHSHGSLQLSVTPVSRYSVPSLDSMGMMHECGTQAYIQTKYQYT